MAKIGIRKEDKNIWERRVPLVPSMVKRLIADEGLEVQVQSSTNRAFSDEAYVEAGASVAADLPDAPVLFAVKEVPIKHLRQKRTYVYFSHVIKGQDYNMPMLQKLLDLETTLIDYEKIANGKGRRLVFFGRHAGLAGMIDSLSALGQRLAGEGFDTPLAQVKMAHQYADLDAAKEDIARIGKLVAEQGLPEGLVPMVVGFTGYGNVSQGAQEIFDLLPSRQVEPEELTGLTQDKNKPFIKVVFQEKHMVVPRDEKAKFELQDYYQHPEKYRGVFASYVPHLHVLVNCIYWTPDYPRLVTRDLLHGLYGAGCKPKLRVIGDISIDIEGAVECSLKATESGDPIYVYLPAEDRIVSGVEGHGPVIMAVDNLPCELPVESSQDFGKALMPYVAAIANADYGLSFDELDLPASIKRAVICHQGKLTPDFEYLYEILGENQKDSTQGGES